MKKVLYLATVLLTVVATFLSCSKDDENPILLTLDQTYSTPICHVLEVTPKVEGVQNGLYLWTIGDSTISTSSKLEFITATAGSYKVKLVVTEGSRKTTKEFTIQATNVTYSKLSTLVYDYNPTLGSYVNDIAGGCKTKEEALAKINTKVKTGKNLSLTLGCLGGTAVFSFDHTIMNVPGKDDFEVLISGYSRRGLGVVYVAYDRNKNGKPDDDEWYEIPGNLEGTKEMVSDYEVTISHERVDDPNEGVTYYNWTDNKGNKGTYVSQDYYEWIQVSEYIFPTWINEDIKCSGKMVVVNHDTFTKDAANNHYGHYLYPTGTLSVQSTPFDISKAVDAKGNPVSLPGADFVKIKSAIFCEYPLNGYYSLVIDQVKDLHLK
jgi:hypothetical protein